MNSSSVDSQTMNQDHEMTALQKHCAFFDRNKDGVIYPNETYEGFRAIGFNILLSAVFAVAVNFALSGITRMGEWPDLRFPIVIKNVKNGKHGSDTDSYDHEGRFVPSKFEEIFRKHAHTRPDAITWTELNEMMKENREPLDFLGWFANYLEWWLMRNLCEDQNGFLKKDMVRAAYDGSLFEQLEKERASSTKRA